MGGITSLEGRVEVFLFGQWDPVCDYNWDLAEATVVCHQLGYPRAVEAFTYGSGPFSYDSVECAGTEMNLIECNYSAYHSAYYRACYWSDVGVRCSSKFCVGVLLYLEMLL